MSEPTRRQRLSSLMAQYADACATLADAEARKQSLYYEIQALMEESDQK
jgi:hypothetical protein